LKRKVIQIAESTQLISLPRKWAIENNIKKGDELEIEVKPNSLVITTTTEREPLGISVDLSGFEPLLVDKFLSRAYQKGYDLINIQFSDPETLDLVQNKVREFLGIEIMHQTKQGCEVKSISSKLDVDFDSLLRKAFLIVVDMIDIALEAYKKGDKKTLENLYMRDTEVNRFAYFCLRELNKFHKSIDAGMGIIYFLIETLEDVGDDIKRLGNTLARVKKVHPDLLEALEQINESVKNAYNFYYKPTKFGAIKTIDNYKALHEKVNKIMQNHKDPAVIDSALRIWGLNRLAYHYTTMRLDTLQELHPGKK